MEILSELGCFKYGLQPKQIVSGKMNKATSLKIKNGMLVNRTDSLSDFVLNDGTKTPDGMIVEYDICNYSKGNGFGKTNLDLGVLIESTRGVLVEMLSTDATGISVGSLVYAKSDGLITLDDTSGVLVGKVMEILEGSFKDDTDSAVNTTRFYISLDLGSANQIAVTAVKKVKHTNEVKGE